MAYQSLYRRYRPKRFAEIKGQKHLVDGLRNAVREGRVGHAYLLHGPRGTGKTSTARVLAKALNCDDLGTDGDPCAVCEQCKAIEENRSFDLHELDAASNNKVDDIRALLETVKLGTPGRMKVYLLDEAHMLTAGAENALLKTLEEPPGHVVWILATTEHHKVAETIRSRCQTFRLSLMGDEELAAHVREIAAHAGIAADDEIVDHVVAAGAGSVRDALSALDRIASAGGVDQIDDSAVAVMDAIASSDPAAALTAGDEAIKAGTEPRRVGEQLLGMLRQAFLWSMGAPQAGLPGTRSEQASDLAQRMTPARLTGAMELLGAALVGMRQSPDPRVDLEVALVRLADPPPADPRTEQRIADLEAAMSQLAEQVSAGVPPGAAPVGEGPAQPPAAPAATPVAASEAPPRQGAGQVPAHPTGAGVEPAEGLSWEQVAALRPCTPSDLVASAERHLGTNSAEVIALSKQYLDPDVPRNADTLAPLWSYLVEKAQSERQPLAVSANTEIAATDADDADGTAPEPDGEPAGAQRTTADEDEDESGLLVKTTLEAFPGSEVVALPTPGSAGLDAEAADR